MAAPTSDPFSLRILARRCGVEDKYFSIVPQEENKVTVFDANRDPLFSSTEAKVKAFLAGVLEGCDIVNGRPRQQTLFGGATKAPKPPPKPLPSRKERLF